MERDTDITSKNVTLNGVVLTDPLLIKALASPMWAYTWAVSNTISGVCRWSDSAVAEAAGVKRTTAMRWRHALAEAGLVRELRRERSEFRLAVVHLPVQSVTKKLSTGTRRSTIRTASTEESSTQQENHAESQRLAEYWYSEYGRALGLEMPFESHMKKRDTGAAKTLLARYPYAECQEIIKAFLADQWWRDHCDGNLARVIGRADVLRLQAKGQIKPTRPTITQRFSRIIQQDTSITSFKNPELW
jgi:hypothetical protein